ncbi:putative acyl-CoA transferase/carnitine dehydratase [Pseudomonas sp. GM84]|uniref:CaiB/BaiF CoA transferase family protein n=1 Tax=Pseudomonas sp. GM84 TaxID=1144340 RepID=UPI00026F4CC5|nr:CoA transferase [Pseudomonas sp. GM84]EJN39643.1 putative acyl-CoA transferase/carnitine dehydratase [Pseudomonas sp. GM84]
MNQQQALDSKGKKLLLGVTILDLTRVVSGPFATMQLGDLGARIIKIEEPLRGDDSRAFGPPFIEGESAYFLSVNRNKQSVAIDLKTAEGKRLLLQIAAKADVIIENFRPGTMERLGLSSDVLKTVNPALIHCSISGFGTSGPDAQRPGYDLILQGESGIMDITGESDRQPTKVGTSIADMIAGLYAAQAITAALHHRLVSGEAHSVHISMLDSLASLLTFNAGIYYATGESPTRRGNEHPTICPYETFPTADGWLNLAVANDKFWALFCQVTDAQSLANDHRFKTAPERVSNRNELRPLVAEILKQHDRAHWMAVFSKAGIPCGEIKSVGEVCEAEQLRSRGMIIEMTHPTAGTVVNIDSPIRVDDVNGDGDIAPPLLGQHTQDILLEMTGVSREEIEALERDGIVKTWKQTAP